jgi:hypothetical protein
VQAARPVREAARGNGTDGNTVTAPRADLTSPPKSSTTSGVGSSKRSTATAAAVTTRSIGSGTSCAGRENLTKRQQSRLEAAWVADERHVEVEVAWLCAQQVRDCYHQGSHAAGRAIAEKVLASFTTCPIPEVKRLGKTLNQWRREFLGYFDTDGANNGGTEAVNGLIELHRRIARGFRNLENYRLRMLLIGGGLNL